MVITYEGSPIFTTESILHRVVLICNSTVTQTIVNILMIT